MIDQASQQISAENTELACAFIQKTAMEKAMPEMEKRLTEVISSDVNDYIIILDFLLDRNLICVKWQGMREGDIVILQHLRIKLKGCLNRYVSMYVH